MFRKGGAVQYLPYAFTENGVYMLAAVLKSKVAVDMIPVGDEVACS